ncbi:MAG: sulfatase-like hydrolase/transferase, partial [Planctomycetota bacterium]
MGLAGSAVTLPGCLSGLARREKSSPNIIFIMADDLGYHDLACYGSRKIPTPNCDRLADEGMKFTDAHSPSAVCTPTRYGVLTGRYCWRTWLKDWVINDRMPLVIEEGRLTVPAMMKKYGYMTGCIGKWHLGWGRRNDAYQKGILEPGPLEVGFDSFFGVPFSHNSPPASEVFVRDRSIVGIKDGESIMDQAVFNRCRRKLEDTATELSAEAIQFI